MVSVFYVIRFIFLAGAASFGSLFGLAVGMFGCMILWIISGLWLGVGRGSSL